MMRIMRVVMRVIPVVALALLLSAPVTLDAQRGQQQRRRSRTPAPYAAFWARFKAAVAKNDREAVASMTKLPFLLENAEIGREKFIEKFDYFFDRRTKRCFARAKPVAESDGFDIFCGQEIFYFALSDGEYKFLSIGPND